MTENYDQLKQYELSPAEQMIFMPLKYSLHKNIAQIPTYMLIEEPINWELMQQALDIEIQRNDCLRLKFVQTDQGMRQVFLPELHIGKVPYLDFSKKSEASMLAALQKYATKTLKYKKGENYRIVFFTAPDGRSGIFFNAFHAVLDTIAIFNFYDDLLKVYKSLEDHTELPEPMTRYEDSLQRELDYEHDEKKSAKDIEFFREYQQNSPSIQYYGIDAGRLLEAYRKKKKDPNRRGIKGFYLLKCNADSVYRHIDGQTIERWIQFLNENRVSYQSLMHLGMHIALSHLNGGTTVHYMSIAENRRTKRDDLRCGGNRVSGHSVYTEIPLETTFKDAATYVFKELLKIMRHSDCSPLRAIAFSSEQHKSESSEMSHSISYSILPPGSIFSPEGWHCEFNGMTTGYFMSPEFMLAVPSMKDGGMDHFYQYYTILYTEEEQVRFHDLWVKAIEAGIENPQKTIGEIVQNL